MPESISATTPEDSMIKKERHQLLTQGLRTLPKVQQRALWLRYMKGLSYREIVWEMQAPLGTVKIWLYRGRHQLKRALKTRGWERDLGLLGLTDGFKKVFIFGHYCIKTGHFLNHQFQAIFHK